MLIEAPQGAGFVFLQSMARASLCFAALPILMVDETYQLAIAPEDLGDLGLDTQHQPRLGSEVTVLALVSMHDEFLATANLMAPIVLNVQIRRGLQAIRHDSCYSHEYPIVNRAAQKSVSEEVC